MLIEFPGGPVSEEQYLNHSVLLWGQQCQREIIVTNQILLAEQTGSWL